MLIVVHYCYRFLCTVVTDSCALLLPFFVHSPCHFLCTRDFCLQGGLVLYCKLLESGTFGKPSGLAKDAVSGSIEWSELVMVVEGIIEQPDSRRQRLENLKKLRR